MVLHQSSPSPGLWNVRNPALLGLVPLWIGDSAAYFVGRGIGKTPLAPTISPKKTVEGAIANLIFSIA
ncbi:phosphatidate cytidylyltransferase, partial [Streptomyces turgidiscabies]|uniref:phosphatidate cytidylyltransferase n=1 Tax=Streptomyces turgidiscabies TaxID=85558 RepID=UPI0038F7ECFF